MAVPASKNRGRRSGKSGSRRFKVTKESFQAFLEESRVVTFFRKLSLTEKEDGEKNERLLLNDSLSDRSYTTPESSSDRGIIRLPKLDLSLLSNNNNYNGMKSGPSLLGAHRARSSSTAGRSSPRRVRQPGRMSHASMMNNHNNYARSSYASGVYDVPPSNSRVLFPSELRTDSPGGYYTNVHPQQMNSLFSSEPALNNGDRRPNGHHRAEEVAFPSSYREREGPNQGHFEQPQQPLFNSGGPAHNFTQHLRERSPSSSSALLNLLQRYPSARQSVYNQGVSGSYRDGSGTFRSEGGASFRETTGSSGGAFLSFGAAGFREGSQPPGARIYQAEERVVDKQVFRPAGNVLPPGAGYPLVEVAVPKQTAPLVATAEHFHQPRTNGFSGGIGNAFGTARISGDQFQSSYKNYTAESAPRRPLQQPSQWLDIDSLFSSTEDEMNRSTAEWKSSFQQMKERFRRPPEETDSSIFHGFASSGAPSPGFPGGATLPRFLSKSSSQHELLHNDRSGLLASAVNHRAQEAPEPRGPPRSGALDTFWSNTVNSRPSSPTVQRISSNLTAAERLQLLQEPVDGPAVLPRMGSRSALAARREQYLQEAQSPPWNQKSTSPSAPLSPRLTPNFSDLDSAVQELQHPCRTGYSQGARRLGGCARFPTEETSLSPPRMVSRKLSPSPTDTVSETSSVYQVPTGLPHPKPKHNIKEQIYQAGVQNNYFPRIGLRTTPNFPVPSTGSVASRITEFEKRPGTPTLHIATSYSDGATRSFETGPMSPISTVFRSKPTIHVDIGSSHHRPAEQATTAINFKTPAVEPPLHSATVGHRRTPRLQLDFGHLSPQNGHHDSYSSNSSLEPTAPSRGISLNRSVRGLEEDVCPYDESYILSPKILPAPVVVKREQRKVPPPPKFYFPQGKPVSATENDAALRRVCEVFRSLPGQTCSFENMDRVCKAAGIPLYWKKAVYRCMAKEEGKSVTQIDFTVYWKAMTSVAHDEASRFVYTLTGGSASQLRHDHFVPVVMDIIHTHPGLAFYRSAVEFHDKYADVVITRIFWNHGRPWAPHLTVEDIRKGDLLEHIRELEAEEDINKSLRYFSYEHFYVVYCLFWEIDSDHDLKIRREDLELHEKGAIPPMIIERIFSRAVCRQGQGRVTELGIKEFTQFLLADEDKTHPSSVEYWFRVLDEDGDGIISLYDMERYYGGIEKKLLSEGIDCMKFGDVACNLIDAIAPKQETAFRRADLKNNKLAPRFFNSFVNWRKFYIQETTEGSDPVRVEDENGRELTDWDKFCAEEYESLMEAEQENEDSFDVCLDDDEEDHQPGSAAYNQLL